MTSSSSKPGGLASITVSKTEKFETGIAIADAAATTGTQLRSTEKREGLPKSTSRETAEISQVFPRLGEKPQVMHFSPIRSLSLALAAGALLLLSATGASATPLAEWNFDDGTANDLLGNYDLTAVGGGPSIAGGYAQFSGSEGSPSFLESSGFGGNPTWSIALRLRVDGAADQGTFQGILSNNNSNTASFSWQIESSGGIYQLRTLNGTHAIGAPTGGFDSIVVRKLNSSDGDIWFNGVQVVASLGSNPGGLQNFRLGTNRNTNNFYAFTLDTVRVYDSVENPALIPEPNSALLIGLGLMALGTHRRSARRP